MDKQAEVRYPVSPEEGLTHTLTLTLPDPCANPLQPLYLSLRLTSALDVALGLTRALRCLRAQRIKDTERDVKELGDDVARVRPGGLSGHCLGQVRRRGVWLLRVRTCSLLLQRGWEVETLATHAGLEYDQVSVQLSF